MIKIRSASWQILHEIQLKLNQWTFLKKESNPIYLYYLFSLYLLLGIGTLNITGSGTGSKIFYLVLTMENLQKAC